MKSLLSHSNQVGETAIYTTEIIDMQCNRGIREMQLEVVSRETSKKASQRG